MKIEDRLEWLDAMKDDLNVHGRTALRLVVSIAFRQCMLANQTPLVYSSPECTNEEMAAWVWNQVRDWFRTHTDKDIKKEWT